MDNNHSAIVLFNDDFRVEDHSPLLAASKKYSAILPLFIYNENYLGRKLGAASKVFLNNLLESFNKLLIKKYGISLILRQGDVIVELEKIIKDYNIKAIYFHHSYTQIQIKLEKLIKERFNNLEVISFEGKLLFEPHQIKTVQGTSFKVYSPFWRECMKKFHLIAPSCPPPSSLGSLLSIKSVLLEELQLLPKVEGDWHNQASSYWNFNYEDIEKNINHFFGSDIEGYAYRRNKPANDATSRFSPYIRFGVISPRRLYHQFIGTLPSSYKFLSEVVWREFCFHVLLDYPDLHEKEVKSDYAAFENDENEKFFMAWKKGQTGYEIIDAGMRELWQTGYMHNRVRMLTASFMIKDLLINWKSGEQWFWDTLFDACPAVNPFAWQWVFGSGFDSSPSFRIFNPDLQQDKFDKMKRYCRLWLPENYNYERIVNHEMQRKIALGRYKKIKGEYTNNKLVLDFSSNDKK